MRTELSSNCHTAIQWIWKCSLAATNIEERAEIDWAMNCWMALTKPGFLKHTKHLPQKLPISSNVLQSYLDIPKQDQILGCVLLKEWSYWKNMEKCSHSGENQSSLWRSLQNWKVFAFLSWIKGYLKWIKGRTKHYTKKLNFSSGRVDEIYLGVMTSDRHIMERENSVND